MLFQEFSIVFKCGPDTDLHMWAGEGVVGINLCQSKFSLESVAGNQLRYFKLHKGQTQPSLPPCVNAIEYFMYLGAILAEKRFKTLSFRRQLKDLKV